MADHQEGHLPVISCLKDRLEAWALRLRSFRQWLKLAFLWPLAVGVIALFLSGWTEQAFRFVGLALQALGLATVFLSVMGIRAEFGAKLKELDPPPEQPRNPGPAITGSANASTQRATARGRGHLSPVPGCSPVERTTSALQQIEQLHMQIGRLETRAAKLEAQLVAEAAQRSHAVADLGQSLLRVSGGGLHLTVVSTFLVLVGMVLSILSPEASRLARALF